jgi:hypothetical protein
MPHIEIFLSRIECNAGAQRAGTRFVEAGVRLWFRKLSRFMRLVSNSSNAGQSLSPVASAQWKSRHADTCSRRMALRREGASGALDY